MKLRSDVEVLAGALYEEIHLPRDSASIDVLTELQYDVIDVQELVDAVLKHHQDYCTPGSAWLCAQSACKLAANL